MEPVTLEDGRVLIWSRRATLAGCAAVGLTVDMLQGSSDEVVEAAIDDVLNWLEANKPKSAGLALPVRERERAGGVGVDGGQTGVGAKSPGVTAAEVEGDANGGEESPLQGT